MDEIKNACESVIRAINNYLLPFFRRMFLANITPVKVREYEQWRKDKIGRVPISSTLANHSSAFNKIIDLAIEQGWIINKVGIPGLSCKGGRASTPIFY